LIDGDDGIENWNRIGDANWRAEGGVIMADKGKGGFLVSKNAYPDFVIGAEFRAETDTNSGILIRAPDASASAPARRSGARAPPGLLRAVERAAGRMANHPRPRIERQVNADP